MPDVVNLGVHGRGTRPAGGGKGLGTLALFQRSKKLFGFFVPRTPTASLTRTSARACPPTPARPP